MWGYVRLFGLRDDRVDLWEWFIENCEWYDSWREFRNYSKELKCKFTNLSLLLKNIWIMNYNIFFCVSLNQLKFSNI